MNDYSFSVQNIADGNGVNISLTGMLIVFSGLIFISVYIWLLPILLGFYDRIGSNNKAGQIAEKKAPVVIADVPQADDFDSEANDIASVIGLVLNLEQERLAMTANEQITITRNTGQRSIWGTAGKMRSMPRRRSHA